MKVSELIEKLINLPKDAEVKYLYDGSLYGNTPLVYLSKGGNVVLADYDEPIYSEKNIPLNEKFSTDNLGYYTPPNPNPEECEYGI